MIEDFVELWTLTSILASSNPWYYKACLEVFPLSDLAEILCECIKFDFAKILFQPRGCMTSLEIRGHSRPPEAEVIFDILKQGEVVWVPYMGV